MCFTEELSEIVTNTPNELLEHRPRPQSCPICNSDKMQSFGGMQTLVSSYGKYNINHCWNECLCNSCGLRFILESKGQKDGYNWWTTVDGKLINGVPSCFEPYKYTCRNCNGNVTKDYRNYSDDQPSNGQEFSWKEGEGYIAHQYEFWTCDGCDVSLKVDK